jgi:hypothetical protein
MRRTLTLRREALTELTGADLTGVRGGADTYAQCASNRLTGCTVCDLVRRTTDVQFDSQLVCP